MLRYRETCYKHLYNYLFVPFKSCHLWAWISHIVDINDYIRSFVCTFFFSFPSDFSSWYLYSQILYVIVYLLFVLFWLRVASFLLLFQSPFRFFKFFFIFIFFQNSYSSFPFQFFPLFLGHRPPHLSIIIPFHFDTLLNRTTKSSSNQNSEPEPEPEPFKSCWERIDVAWSKKHLNAIIQRTLGVCGWKRYEDYSDDTCTP